MTDADAPWHVRAGGAAVARTVLGSRGARDPPASLLPAAVALLTDPEPRVRLAAADVLGGLAARDPAGTWAAAGPAVAAVVGRDWDRDGAADGGPVAPAAPTPASDGLLSDALAAAYAPPVPGAGELRHGSEGWRCLETAFRALLAIMDGAGPAFAPLATPDVRALVTRALLHPNRYVREQAYSALAALATLAGADGSLAGWADAAAASLADGLSENWSQVRLAACVAARALLAAAEGDAELHARVLDALLPPLALNRRDAAEGVASYSADTWVRATRGRGAACVAARVDAVSSYYLRCARTNNHTVREAAAACLGELAAKVDAGAVAGVADRAVATLRALARDDAWPVRDAAAAALAAYAVAHPAAVEPWLDDVLTIWADGLDDNVPSVRDGAAAALGAAARAPAPLGDRVADATQALIAARLPRVGDQPAGGDLMPAARGGGGGAAAAPTQAPTRMPGSAPAPLDAASTDPLFRPGALLRPKRDAGGVDYSCGCMDYGYRRPKLPWEAADGAARALRELAPARPDAVVALLPALADAVERRHYAAVPLFRTTVWEALLPIADAVGVRAFKRHLDPLLAPLLESLTGDHALCRVAAGAALGGLRDRLGPRIFAGRLDDDQRRALEASGDVPPAGGAYGPRSGGGAGAATAPAVGRAPWAAPAVEGATAGLGRPAYAPGGFPMRVPGGGGGGGGAGGGA